METDAASEGDRSSKIFGIKTRSLNKSTTVVKFVVN